MTLFTKKSRGTAADVVEPVVQSASGRLFAQRRGSSEAAPAEVLEVVSDLRVDEPAAEATDGTSQPRPDPLDEATEVIAPGIQKRGFLARRVKKVSAGKAPKAQKVRRTFAVPIRVFIGYLPDVMERDAQQYALGIAEKHFEQPSLAFYDAFSFGTGFAYEVHEGGTGGAFLPEIIEHFNGLPPFEPGEKHQAVIRTGTRMVSVQRDRVGLNAVILPESSLAVQSEWLAPKERLMSALNERTAFLAVGAGVFITGFLLAIITGLYTRFQAYEPPPADKPYVAPRVSTLPSAQWDVVKGLPSDRYVTKLEFKAGKWLPPVTNGVAGHGPDAPPPAAGAGGAVPPGPPPSPTGGPGADGAPVAAPTTVPVLPTPPAALPTTVGSAAAAPAAPQPLKK